MSAGAPRWTAATVAATAWMPCSADASAPRCTDLLPDSALGAVSHDRPEDPHGPEVAVLSVSS